MKSTFSVIYYLKRQVVKKDGTVPVMGRITVDGSQTQFSCKLTVDPKLWDTKGGRVTGRSTAALETNRMLDKMRVRINKHYQEIMERDNFVTAEKVKNAFLGLEHRYHTLMQVFRNKEAKPENVGKQSDPDDIYATLDWETNPPINGFYETMMSLTPERRKALRFEAERHRQEQLKKSGVKDTLDPAFVPSSGNMDQKPEQKEEVKRVT